jgi:TolB protein
VSASRPLVARPGVWSLLLLLALAVSGSAAGAGGVQGGRIVFGDSGGEIFVVSPDGSNLRQLTHEGGAASPAWSPDGKTIAYLGAQNSLRTIPAGGGRSRVLYRADPYVAAIDSLAWSPDGARVAFTVLTSVNPQLWILARDGHLARFAIAFAVHPTWSPDGKQIAYGGQTRAGHGSIFVMRANGAGRRDLSRAMVEDENPSWSPDGRWIAFRRLNRAWM